MLNIRKLSSSITILFLFANFIVAQTNPVQQIDSLLKGSNQIGVFNGNVLVSKNNTIIYKASFGFTDATKTNKLTDNSKFNIGSITKEFSAVALMQLQEQGKLKLEDKVAKFIPELPKWANEVSIENLLQFTSGIPNVIWKNIKNDKDLFEGLMAVDSLIFKPGTKYDYNNNNIFLRHFIVERIAQIPYKTYVEKFIFKPCKMDSALLTPFENEENIAKGFATNLVPDKKDLPITGGTYLTTMDLLKWLNCLHHHKVIHKKSLFTLGQPFDLPETQSALGQAKYKNEKLTEHIHHGRAGSYEALMISNLDENFTIILLNNNYSGKIFEISAAITAILKDQKYSFPKSN